MKKAKRFNLVSIIITAALSVLVTLGAVALLAWLWLGTPGLAVVSGYLHINDRFVGEYDKDAVADAALDAMVESLGDRWSYYADPETYAALQERRSNSYVGIGVTVTYEEDGLHIQEVTEGSPAQAAGLLAGEIITAADDNNLTGADAGRATELIQGEEGTQVILTVLDAAGTARQVMVTRARVKNQPVSYELMEGGVGYVALDNFYDGSAEQVMAAVEDLQVQGATALLFDMRNNPGGYLEELLDLLDYLLPEGDIFRSGDRSGPQEITTSDAACVDLPMAVLVNADSYSAAELFAAQLRESVGAVIIGETTCGKGYSQQSFELPGERGINISTKTYYTGAGQSLIGVGVVPDIPVEQTGEQDDQLNAALDSLIS